LLSDLFLHILFKEELKDKEVDGDSDKQSRFTATFPFSFSEFENSVTISNLEAPPSLKPLSSVDSLLTSVDLRSSIAMSLSSPTAGALQTGQLE
jgi:hypothetical protein